jgi:phosphoribosyl-ATP pyrophosphohydrolase
MTTEQHILDSLYQILQERKNETADKSYVASLYAKGAEQIAAKIAEEADELNIEGIALQAAPDNPELRQNLTAETADLLFHMLVMLSHHNIDPEDVFDVLRGRMGISGHDEKASRDQ